MLLLGPRQLCLSPSYSPSHAVLCVRWRHGDSSLPLPVAVNSNHCSCSRGSLQGGYQRGKGNRQQRPCCPWRTPSHADTCHVLPRCCWSCCLCCSHAARGGTGPHPRSPTAATARGYVSAYHSLSSDEASMALVTGGGLADSKLITCRVWAPHCWNGDGRWVLEYVTDGCHHCWPPGGCWTCLAARSAPSLLDKLSRLRLWAYLAQNALSK